MSDVPEGHIIITPKEFYDGVQRDIAEIKKSAQEIQLAVSPIAYEVRDHGERIEKIESKLGGIEKRIAGWSAVAGVLLILLSQVDLTSIFK